MDGSRFERRSFDVLVWRTDDGERWKGSDERGGDGKPVRGGSRVLLPVSEQHGVLHPVRFGGKCVRAAVSGRAGVEPAAADVCRSPPERVRRR